MSDQTQPPTPPDPAPPDLGGLNPRDLIAGGLQSAVPRPQGWQPPEPEVLARLLPQYQIEAFLGRGGMGAVYRGRQMALDRAIALKLLPAELTADAEFVGRFQREARTLARLQHPGIVAIYDFGQTTEGHLYFVMEYVDGTDLQRIIHGPGVNPAQALEIVGQVCEALQYAHTHGVVHRDIKPANVLLTQDGRAKLADFGLARPTNDDSGGFTRSNVVMGTPDYIAPEQMYGQADHRADLFSLGVMLYEMLTGQTPRGAWAPPSQRVRVDVRLDQVVIRALQQDVAMRYQQASEMKVDVDTIRTTPLPVATQAKKPQAPAPQKPAAAKPAPAQVRAPEKVAPSPRKKSSNSWLLATALPLVAAGFGYWMIFRTEPEETGSSTDQSATVSDSQPAAFKWQQTQWAPPHRGQVNAEGWLQTGQFSSPYDFKDRFINFGDTAIRFRLRWRDNKKLLIFSIRRNNGKNPGSLQMVIAWNSLELRRSLDTPPSGEPSFAVLSHTDLVQPMRSGSEIAVECLTVGSQFHFRINGQSISVTDPKVSAIGQALIGGGGADIRDFEYADLTGVGEPLKALGWEVTSPLKGLSAGPTKEAGTPALPQPPALKVPVPAWLQKARQEGGILTFFKTKDLPPPYDQIFDFGEAAKFDDFVEVYAQPYSWMARRKNGEVWGKTWDALGGITSIAPIQAKSVSRAYQSFILSADGQTVWLYGNRILRESPNLPALAKVLGFAADEETKKMRLFLDSGGRILELTGAHPSVHPPPADFFLNAPVVSSTIGAYLAAEPGRPLRLWSTEKGQVLPLDKMFDDIVEIDSAGYVALLLRSSGEVVSLHEKGLVNSPKPPPGLGAAIRVRAHVVFGAQHVDGTWTLWPTADSNALLPPVLPAATPLIDLESGGYSLPAKGISTQFLLAIKPRQSVVAGNSETDIRSTEASRMPPMKEYAFGGNRYQLFTEKLNWENAVAAAAAKGGHLLTITSKEEDDFIRTTFGDYFKEGGFFWLGATCKEHTKTAPWTWITGESWGYSNWAPNQPDFGYGGDGHGVYRLWGGEYKWDDAAGSYTHGVVIEFDGAEPASMVEKTPTSTNELTARLADIHAKFQAAYDRDIAPPHAATVAILDSNYLAAVNRALEAATKRGDLDEAVQVRAEAKRVTDKQPMPAEDAESTPAILKTLRSTYRTTLASLEKERDAKAKPYYDRYDSLLADYQKELTQKGKLDDALVVKTRRDELREKGVATSPTKPASLAPEAAGKPQAPVATVAPDAAGEDKFIDWVFSRGGEFNTSADGKFVRARTRQEMPPKPYEIWETVIHKDGISDKDLAMITAVPTLQIVYITGSNDFSTLKPFAALPKLRALWLERTPLKEEEVAHLAGLTRLDGLTLNLKNGTGEGLAHLRGSNTLKTVKLINGSLSAAGAQAIAALQQVNNLTLDAFVQRKNQGHLAALTGLPNLTRLSLTHCQLGEEAFKSIAGMKNLVYLNLSDSEFDNAGFAHLAPLGPTLKSLDMQYSATVTDEGLAHIAANLPNLDTISVSTGASCTEKGLRELAKLPKLTKISWWVKGMKAKDYQLLADLPAIERITLNTTEITDDGLSTFPKSKTLVFLNLDNNAITDKGLAHLQAIPNLKEVVLKSTKVTAAGLAAFQKARPEVKVTR